MIIMLDAGPVGMLSNASGDEENARCQAWFARLPLDRVLPVVPEIADYEVRRELLRARKTTGLAHLDALTSTVTYLSIDTATMRRAAELWARARQRGRPKADPHALDADVILAAQAQLLGEATGDEVVVATTNIRHLAQFVDARRWQEVEP
jgi:predicted nucleic acid-binding protein